MTWVTVDHTQTGRTDTTFDGRIQLNGDTAPELEVIVQLDDQFIVLGHSSGELGRWERDTVRVSPIGRGWFTLDVEDETVTFLPRRPGHFAASTVDLIPVEETKKLFRRKSRSKAETPTLSRKERKRLEREATAKASVDSATKVAPPAADVSAPVFEPGPAPDLVEPAPMPVEQPVAPAEPIPAPVPVEQPVAPVEPIPAPAPEIRSPDAPPVPPAEPTSPWDDLPLPEIPGKKPRTRKSPGSSPVAPPRPTPEKQSKRPRDKAPKPPRAKAPKGSRGKAVELAGSARAVKPARPAKKNAFSRLSAGFWYGLKGVALRISDELRQTGIVPFDRLPAASGHTRPKENHKHDFQEHRLPGGLTRNVCYECGLVSIGESGEDD